MTTKIEQLKLPEPGQTENLKIDREGWAATVKAVSTRRALVKLVKRPPEKK